MTERSGAVRRATPTILVVTAAICFGTTGTAQALGGQGASALSLGAARIVFGGGLLAVVALIALLVGRATVRRVPDESGAEERVPDDRGSILGSGTPTLTRGPRSRRSRTRWLAPAALVAVGAVGVAGYQPAFFTGTSQNGVAVGTLVALGSAPVLTGLLEWLVRRKAPGLRWAIATAVAALGVCALSGVFAGSATATAASAPVSSATSAGTSVITPLGIAASLVAGLCYAVYALSSKALLDRRWSPTAAMGATFGGAAVVMTPVLLATDLQWLATPAGALTAGWLAIVTTTLAYTLFARGLRRLRASRTATLTLVEPLTATVLGVVVLHEQFTASIVIGLGLLVAGLAILTVSWPRRRPAIAAGAGS
ncbi:MAG: EamA family transporter [Subtercola sp.]|nr:EamA family transporter [Subtercola sp.]